MKFYQKSQEFLDISIQIKYNIRVTTRLSISYGEGNMAKTPIATKPKGDKKIICYRCPTCKEYIFSTWDEVSHKIKRPDKCRDCGQELNWDAALENQMQVFAEV